MDVFPNHLPLGLSLECSVTHGIDLIDKSDQLSKPPYHLSASEVIEVANYLQHGFIQASKSPLVLPFF